MRIDQLGSKAREYIETFFVKSAVVSPFKKNESLNSSDLGKIELQVLLKDKADLELVSKSINERINVAPLSIFGIKVKIEIIPFDTWTNDNFESEIKLGKWYLYKNGNFYNYSEELKTGELKQAFNKISSKTPNIISCLKLAVESPIKV
ncbi:hypothetical protein BH10ACI1_BH10ACI1_28290 [soil metagenome]